MRGVQLMAGSKNGLLMLPPCRPEPAPGAEEDKGGFSFLQSSRNILFHHFSFTSNYIPPHT